VTAPSVQVALEGGRDEAAEGARPARIGPNAVSQSLRALRELESPDVVCAVVARAHLPEDWPEGLIPEGWFVRLVHALRQTLPAERAEAILRRSGRYTADYVGRRRIPKVFRLLLAVLPARLALPLLLGAFRRHAWTFAGSGSFRVEGPFPGTIVLDGCPTCRPEAAAQPPQGGAYYEGAFTGLLQLAAGAVHVREVACRTRGPAPCRFRISLEG